MKNCISCGKLLEKSEDYFNGDETRDYCLECTSTNGETMLYEEKLLQMVDKLVKSQGLDKQAARTVASNILLKMPAWKEKSDEEKPKNAIRWKIVLSIMVVFAIVISSLYFGINRNYYNYFGTQLKIMKMGEDSENKGIDEYTVLHDSSTLVNSDGLSPIDDGDTYNQRGSVVEIRCVGDQVKPIVSKTLPSFTFLNWEDDNTLLYNTTHPLNYTDPYSFKGWQCYTYNMTTEGMSDNTAGVGYKLDSDGFEGVIRSGADSFDWWERRDGKIFVKSRGYKGGGTWTLLEKDDSSQKNTNIQKPKVFSTGDYVAILSYFELTPEEEEIRKSYLSGPTKAKMEIYSANTKGQKAYFGSTEIKPFEIWALTDKFLIYSVTSYNKEPKSGGYVHSKIYYLNRFENNTTAEFKMTYLDHNNRYILGYAKDSGQNFFDIQVFDTQTGITSNLFTEEDIKNISGKSKAELLKTDDFYSSVENIYISQDSGMGNNAVIAFDFFFNGIFYKRVSELDKPVIDICNKDGFWGNVLLVPEAVTTKYIAFQISSIGYEQEDPLALKGIYGIGMDNSYGINLHIIDKNKNVKLDDGQCHSLSMNNEIAVWVKNYGFASDSQRELCFAYLKAIE